MLLLFSRGRVSSDNHLVSGSYIAPDLHAPRFKSSMMQTSEALESTALAEPGHVDIPKLVAVGRESSALIGQFGLKVHQLGMDR